MSSSEIVSHATEAGPAAAKASSSSGNRYFVSPLVDFFCLGGGSSILLAAMCLLPLEDHETAISSLALGLAFVVNYPHFAHSYQMFYKGFAKKAFRSNASRALRFRYRVAGIVVPLMLAAFFAIAAYNGNLRMMGYGADLMFLLVGWHYVKQGYGILMVEAAFKRRFFGEREKKVLLANSYAVWLFSWCAANDALNERNFAGLKYYMLDVPDVAIAILGLAAAATTGAALWVFVRKLRTADSGLPWSGTLAYLASLYAWILLVGVHPHGAWFGAWVLLVPTLHSLQYLVVTWRYQLAYEADGTSGRRLLFPNLRVRRCHLNMAVFIAAGILLGFAGFYALPALLQTLVHYDVQSLGPNMFGYVTWIFINVHHYFLDNVMWRRENAEVRRHLFS
jgi:hypothetical protein